MIESSFRFLMSAVIGGGRGAETADGSQEVRAHLNRLLASPAFRTSKRCGRFLEFIVNESLSGRAASLKERTLAVEVFDRSASWDAGDDTIVRVGAREVRKRLAQYYSASEAANERIRIVLPLGSYVPDFVRLEVPPEIPLPSPPVGAPLAELPRRRTGWWLPAVLLAALCLLIFLTLKSVEPGKNAAFEAFWNPFFRSRDPVIVAVAHPMVYTPSAHAYQLNSIKINGPQDASAPLKLPPEALNGADFLPQPDQYLAYGDAAAATNVNVLLALHGREAHLRFASKVEFADLREAPAVIIGAFTNRWTVELTQHLRYHFGYNQVWVPAILDAKNPEKYWTTVNQNGTSSEDYFLICRLVNSSSGNLVVVGAGVGQIGTEAAGRFLTIPERLSGVLQTLASDWSHHNLELVLHARVIGNSPADSELVASYIW
jgi:hypothetical protein